MPVPDLGQEMGEMFLYFDEFGYTGGEEGVVHAQDVSSPLVEDWRPVLGKRRRLTEFTARGPVPVEYLGGVYKVRGRVGRCALNSHSLRLGNIALHMFFTESQLLILTATSQCSKRSYRKNLA